MYKKQQNDGNVGAKDSTAFHAIYTTTGIGM